MAEVDLMDPSQSPHRAERVGVRRLNSRPLWIVIGVIVAFLLVMAKTAMDRSDEQRLRTASTQSQGGDATAFAQRIAGKAPEGYIPPAPLEVPLVPITRADLDVPPLPPFLPPSDVRTQTETTVVNRGETEADRIRAMKFAALMNAAKAPTGAMPREVGRANGQPQANGKTTPVTFAPHRMQDLQQRLAASGGGATHGGAGTRRPGPQAVTDQLALADPVQGQEDSASDFASRANVDQWDTSSPGRDRWRLGSRVQAPRTTYELRAGTVIAAVLTTGINSDLAGPILGQISQNVYDTATGKHLLIPQGTKLFGRYSNEIAYGQSRVLVGWQRLTYPDGKTLDLGAMPGADEAGSAGFGDQVNNHYLRLFGNALLLSAVTGGVALSQRDSNAGGAFGRQSAGDVMSQQLGIALGQTIVQVIRRNINISPTIEIRPGYRFNVIATKDLTFATPYRDFDYRTQGEPQ